jgi:hypothetical protein
MHDQIDPETRVEIENLRGEAPGIARVEMRIGNDTEGQGQITLDTVDAAA